MLVQFDRVANDADMRQCKSIDADMCQFNADKRQLRQLMPVCIDTSILKHTESISDKRPSAWSMLNEC